MFGIAGRQTKTGICYQACSAPANLHPRRIGLIGSGFAARQHAALRCSHPLARLDGKLCSCGGFALVFSNFGETSVPRVFILDPCALNKKTTGRDRVFEIPEDKTISYRQTYLEGRGIMPTGPVAVRPSSYTLSNRRADNQAGVFTIHDNSGQPVDAQPRGIITLFTIEKKQIPGARLFLKLSNVNAYTIYPDFGGLAGYIRAMLTNESK